MSTFYIICSVIAALLIFVGTLMQRSAKKKREVTIVMRPERAIGFEPGQELLLQGGEFCSRPLTVLRVDREKGEVTLG